ncbi:acylneuraminate cytidylyltransferase family protein [Stutzerimonas nitrititolerans]|uniref:acylneuraminate cytidylyltransferase family protein n=1 Tax=Stutzerimonas nitrititolerans TaxID=2482751 RepID=UPI0028A664CB|nr:acylneuraminate cytidylyltransferase family protein [Stutzerimonas nitrititolerans]
MVGKCIAIIPARGGSKRILRKNIVDFFGKPMIAWTIEAAQKSGYFERILVSTDDEEIAQVARDHGASVPFLRTECADDHSPVSQATLTSLKQAEAFWDTSFDTVVQLMPNCPLRTAEDITQAIEAFKSKQAVFQISCFKFGWMNPWWAVRLNEQGQSERLFPEAIGARSQDLPPLYCPTGAIWIARSTAFKEASSFYGPGHVFEPMNWIAAVDIDDAEDLEMATAVWALRSQKQN